MRLRFAVPLLVAVAAVAGGAFVLSPAPAVRAQALIVEIPLQAGVTAIAKRLQEAGAVRSDTAFLALGTLRGTARRLKAGEYEVPQGSSTLDVLRLLESGRVRQHPVLHPEGATISELARALEAARLARAEDILRVASDPAFLAAHGIEGPNAEGYVFPDTYQFVRGMRPEDILGRMVQRMKAKLTPDMVARAQARGLSVHELLTLASIVEREAAVAEERKLIAGVFWNRLQISMPLQADPTVQYAVGKERRALTRADLQSDHPYNTYRHAGLPPGPIASPGLGAIEAALDPAPVKYLYFVAVSADGRRHHFSTTVEEHNAAVARYRQSRAAP
ncbi:MAG: endolytic transglycosylase MltG [Candidatus Rokubacteria bacterium]|nr:endolytic transglycosylase MltG [Candidatus Rokubacteria bacterium]